MRISENPCLNRFEKMTARMNTKQAFFLEWVSLEKYIISILGYMQHMNKEHNAEDNGGDLRQSILL